MARPKPISGFPEWLPGGRLVEQHVLGVLRETFELHGFAPVETRAVEPLAQLLRKGETDKEIYVLRRLQSEADEDDTGLGLHFDLTVPFARYVLENAGRLQFPLRRYQIQKAWRGERPQEGRYREFCQADIDIVDRDDLPPHYEAEIPLVVAEALAALPIPPVLIQVNNRKIAEGFYRGVGIEDVQGVLRTVDKLDKIGPGGVHAQLVERVGCTDDQAKATLSLAEISSADLSFVDRVRVLGADHPLLDQGLTELARVVDDGRRFAPGLLVADLRVARGLDYYTGTVYETLLRGHEALGSICSGGRYDDLASGEDGVRYPGVGISVGVTRLVGGLLGRGALEATRSVPTCVLVALPAEQDRPRCNEIAGKLRARGIPSEVAPSAAKYGRQIRFADRRAIPYVWFPAGESGGDEVRDIRSGTQTGADPDEWAPPREDLRPRVVRMVPAGE
ncbi:MAG: histidine--tRNA ligase [Carbonactinosporaceae bacterium]